MAEKLDVRPRDSRANKSNIYISGAFLAISVVVTQSVVASVSLDPWGITALIAFSIAIPLLSAFIYVNQRELDTSKYLPKWFLFQSIIGIFGILASYMGIFAIITRLSWVAGLIFLGLAIPLGFICAHYGQVLEKAAKTEGTIS